MLEKALLVEARGESEMQSDRRLHPAPNGHSRLLHVVFDIQGALGLVLKE